jgi:hypothetical protein
MFNSNTPPIPSCDNKNISIPGVVVHTLNSSTQEVKAGGSQVQGQPGLYSESLSQKKKKHKRLDVAKCTMGVKLPPLRTSHWSKAVIVYVGQFNLLLLI